MLGGVRALRTWLAHAEGKELKALEEQVDAVWKKRLTAGDPVEAYLQRDKVRNLVPSCVENSLQKNAYMGISLDRRTSPHMTKRQDALGGCRAGRVVIVGSRHGNVALAPAAEKIQRSDADCATGWMLFAGAEAVGGVG